MDIAKHIEQLLIEEDCVIVPGLGAFIGNYTGARINPITHIFAPPAKKIAFNQSVQLNDGLLIDHIQRTDNSLSKAKILQLVEDFASNIITLLNNNKIFNLEGIGRLLKNTQGNIEFQPEKDRFPSAESFGLPEFYVKPIERNNKLSKEKNIVMSTSGNNPRPVRRPQGAVPVRPVVRKKKVEGDNPPKKKEKKGGSKLWILFIIIPLVLVGGAGAYVYTSGNNVAFADLFSGKILDIIKGGEKEAEEEVEKSAWEEEEMTTAVDSSAIAAEEEMEEEVDAEETEKEFDSNSNSNYSSSSSGTTISTRTNRYYVIAGAFAVPENAQRYRTKLAQQGYDAKVLEPRGVKNLHRVSIADYSTQREGLAKTDEENDKFGFTLWVLKY